MANNGISWSIRRGVEAMIRHLRHQDKRPRNLWIDALCINQEDDDRHESESGKSREGNKTNTGGNGGTRNTAKRGKKSQREENANQVRKGRVEGTKKRGEKSIQVKQMGTLYQKASCVLIWLGTDDKYEDGGAETLSDLRKVVSGSGASPAFRMETWRVKKLLERRWFYRLWVIQEVALSSGALIMWGFKDARNGALVTGQMSFDTFTRGLWKTLGDEKLSAEIAAVQSRLRAMDTFNASDRSTAVALYEVLFRFQNAQCENDRDRLYALNSLSRWPVEVDYGSDTDDIYTRFALKEVAVRLEFLNYAAAYALSSRASLLPSWVPDWRSTPMYSPLTIRKQPIQRRRPQRSPELVGEYTLFIQGRIVDTVRDVHPQVSSTSLEEFVRLHYDKFSNTENTANKDQLIDPMNTKFITTLTVGRQSFIPTDMINLLTKEGYEFKSGVERMGKLLELALKKLTTKLYSNRVSEKEVVYRDGENERIPTWNEMTRYDQHYLKKCLKEVGLTSQYPAVATIITNMWKEMADEDIKRRTIPLIYFHDTFDSWYRSKRNYLRDRFSLVKARAVFARTHLNDIWRKAALETKPGSYWELERRLNNIKSAIQEVMAERTCFTIESGEIGICHPSAQVGDLIVTIPDAETPLIMRRWTDEDLTDAVRKGMLEEEDLFYGKGAGKKRREYLRLVGDCYVHEYIDDDGHVGKEGIGEIRIL
ncbi:hypothetical protein FB567DRAFT_188365 [Paraphoma chrysanthemicola]|uniref:Heterokaryon incompatibility domain-containing protein n=1 Tax=Paraphoma chrysanthemicola TaxID=798071 RepID=A0A8K0QUW7_9PLEO|nr:hypothetical protein FB567DRAFT_188365 [Paraphoma chrysanthemicola]